jgi:hypothetical protein
MLMAVFWVVTLYGYQHFGGTYHLYFQPENHTASKSRRPPLTSSLPGELQISVNFNTLNPSLRNEKICECRVLGILS